MKLTKTKTMMAVRYHAHGGPEVLLYEPAPRPEPEQGEVLIRVMAAGVNPVDWKMREGGRGPQMLESPVTPGGDVAGVIEEVGPGVSDLRVGDAVYGACGAGAYAQYVVANAGVLALKPERLDFTGAAALPIAAMTAWQAIFDHGGLARGQTILIHGAAGGVGSFAAQLAKWRGAHVLGTSSAGHLDYLRELGVDEPIDYQASRFEALAHGMDVVLDTIGGETQERSWQVLKKGGVLVSTVQPPSQEKAREMGVRAEIFKMEPSRALLVDIANLVEAGILKPHISRILTLEEAQEAQALSQGHHVVGKIILKVG